jgi:osmotically-inducible protein OsmY
MTPQLTETDHALKLRVTEQLQAAPDVDADHIGVAVNDGTLVLAGEVESEHEKEAVLRAAFRVEGLRAMADELVVRHRPGGCEDVDIVRAAAQALAAIATVPEGAVRFTVHDGRVLLTGCLSSTEQRIAVDGAVRRTPGVTGVLNMIDIQPYTSPTADEAAGRILAALVRAAQETAARIHVEAVGTALELTGTVRSPEEVRLVGHAASSIAGVTSVRNGLTVAP